MCNPGTSGGCAVAYARTDFVVFARPVFGPATHMECALNMKLQHSFRDAVRTLKAWRWARRGHRRHLEPTPPSPAVAEQLRAEMNPLTSYFDALSDGPGIWKWRHYFDIYHQHLDRFVGRPTNILEIGVYSGGSLAMWRHYFGDQCTIFGVDIEPSCKAYADSRTKIFIGDQSDRRFWHKFKSETPPMDVIIDDGGHNTDQQVTTFEELLPHLAAGGAYLCEDVVGSDNGFARYMSGFVRNLNAAFIVNNADDPERRQVTPTTKLQSTISSVTFHPYVTVVEKRAIPLTELVSAKHGTQWQPFLS
jgi:cephalosporin hydroxylase